MHVFCTYLDRNYLTSGFALYRSLRRNASEFRLFILCMDDEAFRILSQLNVPEIRLLAIDEVEDYNDELGAVKSNRSLIEYYFTVHSYLPQYILQNYKFEKVTYLDADLYFFSTVDRLFDAIGNASVAVHRHRFSPSGRDKKKFGEFNAGFASFTNNEQGRACASHWAENAIRWCHDRVEDGKFANQKYMEEWPELIDDLAVLDHPGIGLAPWNRSSHVLQTDDDRVLVDGEPLVFYHFSRLRQVHPRIWWPPIQNIDPIEKDAIYRPYIRELLGIRKMISQEYCITDLSKNTIRYPSIYNISDLTLGGLREQMSLWLQLLKSMVRQDLIVIR